MRERGRASEGRGEAGAAHVLELGVRLGLLGERAQVELHRAAHGAHGGPTRHALKQAKRSTVTGSYWRRAMCNALRALLSPFPQCAMASPNPLHTSMLHKVPALQRQITHLLFYCSSMSDMADQVLQTEQGTLQSPNEPDRTE